MLFLVHASQDLEQVNFQRMKYLVSSIVNKFRVGPSWARIGLIVFSDTATVIAPLARSTDLESLEQAIGSAALGERGTNMAKALQLASAEFSSSGTERDVPKIAVLITADKQSPESKASPVGLAAENLSSAGASILVVGVSPKVDRQELELLVISENDIVIAKDFTELVPRVGQIVPRLCETAGECAKPLGHLSSIENITRLS